TQHAAGDELSIADIAIWPWVSRYQFQKIDLHDYPHVLDWYLRLAERPAFQKGYRVPDPAQEISIP
ncbi:MAG: glutathione binding-like protein, partial [Desulfofustis sp.]